MLDDPVCRLVTLLGPGGIGKTRLALEAGKVQCDINFDDVYFVPLQPLTSPEYVISTIAEAIHFQFYPNNNPVEQLLDYLRDKSLLLVLDNFEHLLDAVSIVSDILAYAPRVKVLTTSRERLNLLEEWVYEVRGLRVPASEAETKIEGYSAVQLFMQNARRVHNTFMLTNPQKPAVNRICRLVEGMPLGIELASVWVRALPCETIADEIQRSLDILDTPERNVSPRHKNMRATFEHSWNLLSENERDAFKKLSVCRGGFRIEAAECVAGASFRTLSALVDKSLLRIDSDDRYQIHELLRQYGEEKLNQSPDEKKAVQNLHSAYYMDFVRQSGAMMTVQGRSKEALQSTERELGNVQVAWHWAIERGYFAELDQSYEALWSFFA